MPKNKFLNRPVAAGVNVRVSVTAKSTAAQETGGRVVRMFPVYARSTKESIQVDEKPLFHLSKEDKELWLEQGALREVRAAIRGRALRLNLNMPVMVQPSQSMGPSVIEGYASGKPRAQALVAEWLRNAHPQILPKGVFDKAA